MQDIYLLEFLAEAFQCSVHQYQMLHSTSGPPSINNGAHDTEKLLLKTQVCEEFV